MSGEKKVSKLQCGGKCLKYFLVIINVIFFLLGLVITGVAGYAALDKNSTLHRMIEILHNQILVDGLYILMAVGILLALISFLGIWGALAENRCILFFYLILIVLIFALQLAGIIVSFVELRKVEKKVIAILSEPPPVNKTEVSFRDLFVASLAAVQKRFHCCGITSPSNYGTNPIPESCFAPAPTLPSGVTASSSVVHGEQYTTGCIDSARPYLYWAAGIAIAILLLQIMIMLFTCLLIGDIKKGYQPVA